LIDNSRYVAHVRVNVELVLGPNDSMNIDIVRYAFVSSRSMGAKRVVMAPVRIGMLSYVALLFT
jgi:hypothetical protein